MRGLILTAFIVIPVQVVLINPTRPTKEGGEGVKKIIFEKALGKWGLNAQLDMLQEECGELIASVGRYKRRRESSFTQMMEELADVEIMIAQIKQACIYGVQKFEYNGIKSKKMKRLTRLIASP